MIKNALALIGLVVVCQFSYRKFDKYLRAPIERMVTDAFDDEARRQVP